MGVFGLELIFELPRSPLLAEREKLGGFAPPSVFVLVTFSEGKRDGFSELKQDDLFSKIFLF
jgi:hypothetical protein